MKRPAAFEVAPARVRVRRGPREDGRWYWRADRPDGRGGRIDVWLGWGSRDEAAAAVRKALDARPPDPAVEIETVGDLLDCWLGSVRLDRPDARDRTRLAIEGAVVRLLAHGLGDFDVATLDRRGMAVHAHGAREAGVASGTIARDIKYLRQAWRWAQELNPPQVPFRALPRFAVKVEPTTTRYTPSPAEVAELLRGMSPEVRRALILMAATGCRIGEALSLTWDRVTLDCMLLEVDGKTGPRRVEVPEAVALEMQRWPRQPGGRVANVSSNRVRQALARRSTELRIGRCSPNSLRRHVVDALYESAEGDPAAAAAQLGHSPQTALSHYRRAGAKKRRALMEASDLGVVLAFRPVDGEPEEGTG